MNFNFKKLKLILEENEQEKNVPDLDINSLPNQTKIAMSADPKTHSKHLGQLWDHALKMDYYHNDPRFDGERYSQQIKDNIAKNPTIDWNTLIDVSKHQSTADNPIWGLHLLEDPGFENKNLHDLLKNIPSYHLPDFIDETLMKHSMPRARIEYIGHNLLSPEKIDYYAKNEKDTGVLKNLINSAGKELNHDQITSIINNVKDNPQNGGLFFTLHDRLARKMSPEHIHAMYTNMSPESLENIIQRSTNKPRIEDLINYVPKNKLALRRLSQRADMTKEEKEKISSYLSKIPKLETPEYE